MPWPSWVCAMVQSVSPCRTVYFVTASEGAREAGTTICEPTSSSSGLRRPGFSVRSSCQRCPSPRHEAASFQRESPGLTVTIVSLPELRSDGAMRAAGCVASALGASGAGKIAGGAGANPRGATGGAGSARGRSKGDRLTNGRHGATTRGAGTTTVGGATVTDGSKGWVGGLGEASTGASAKGRGNSAERCSCCDSFSLRRRRAISPSGTSAEFAEGEAAWAFCATVVPLAPCCNFAGPAGAAGC